MLKNPVRAGTLTLGLLALAPASAETVCASGQRFNPRVSLDLPHGAAAAIGSTRIGVGSVSIERL